MVRLTSGVYLTVMHTFSDRVFQMILLLHALILKDAERIFLVFHPNFLKNQMK